MPKYNKAIPAITLRLLLLQPNLQEKDGEGELHGGLNRRPAAKHAAPLQLPLPSGLRRGRCPDLSLT